MLFLEEMRLIWMPSKIKFLGSFSTIATINRLCLLRLQSIHEATVSRGKALRDERDERLQQMAKLQQDIANIPQEAVSEIVGDYAMGECSKMH